MLHRTWILGAQKHAVEPGCDANAAISSQMKGSEHSFSSHMNTATLHGRISELISCVTANDFLELREQCREILA